MLPSEFVFLINFSLEVAPALFERYNKELYNHAVYSKCCDGSSDGAEPSECHDHSGMAATVQSPSSASSRQRSKSRVKRAPHRRLRFAAHVNGFHNPEDDETDAAGATDESPPVTVDSSAKQELGHNKKLVADAAACSDPPPPQRGRKRRMGS